MTLEKVGHRKVGKEEIHTFGFIQEEGIIKVIEEDSWVGGRFLEIGDQIISINNKKVSEHVEAQQLINRSKNFVDLEMFGTPKYHLIHSK